MIDGPEGTELEIGGTAGSIGLLFQCHWGDIAFHLLLSDVGGAYFRSTLWSLYSLLLHYLIIIS